jgi:hypothetical protein
MGAGLRRGGDDGTAATFASQVQQEETQRQLASIRALARSAMARSTTSEGVRGSCG